MGHFTLVLLVASKAPPQVLLCGLSYYLGATIPTPVEGLKAGVAFDYLHIDNRVGVSSGNSSALAGYLSLAATEKLTLHGRVDYIRVGGDGLVGGGNILGAAFAPTDELITTTLTADYSFGRTSSRVRKSAGTPTWMRTAAATSAVVLTIMSSL